MDGVAEQIPVGSDGLCIGCFAACQGKLGSPLLSPAIPQALLGILPVPWDTAKPNKLGRVLVGSWHCISAGSSAFGGPIADWEGWGQPILPKPCFACPPRCCVPNAPALSRCKHSLWVGVGPALCEHVEVQGAGKLLFPRRRPAFPRRLREMRCQCSSAPGSSQPG